MATRKVSINNHARNLGTFDNPIAAFCGTLFVENEVLCLCVLSDFRWMTNRCQGLRTTRMTNANLFSLSRWLGVTNVAEMPFVVVNFHDSMLAYRRAAQKL